MPLTLAEARTAVLDHLDDDNTRWSNTQVDTALSLALSQCLNDYVGSAGGNRFDTVAQFTTSNGYVDLSSYQPIVIRGVSTLVGQRYFPLFQHQMEDRCVDDTSTRTLQVRFVRLFSLPTNTAHPLVVMPADTSLLSSSTAGGASGTYGISAATAGTVIPAPFGATNPFGASRYPTVTTVEASGSSLATTVTIVGTRMGATVTQTITNASSQTVTGTSLIDTFVSATISAISNNAANDTISVGVAATQAPTWDLFDQWVVARAAIFCSVKDADARPELRALEQDLRGSVATTTRIPQALPFPGPGHLYSRIVGWVWDPTNRYLRTVRRL